MYYGNYCKYRDAKGLTDYQVAKGTDLPTAMFTEWKNSEGNGTRPGYTPKLDKMLKITEFLEISIYDLIGKKKGD